MGFIGVPADHVSLLDQGSMVEVTALEKRFSAPEEERTRQLLSQILHEVGEQVRVRRRRP